MEQASREQVKMFFALCRELGYDNEIAKEKAKTKFKLESFNDATKDQLSFLINKLIEEKDKRLMDKIVADGKHDISVCVHCGATVVIEESAVEYPVCNHFNCVKKLYDGQ